MDTYDTEEGLFEFSEAQHVDDLVLIAANII